MHEVTRGSSLWRYLIVGAALLGVLSIGLFVAAATRGFQSKDETLAAAPTPSTTQDSAAGTTPTQATSPTPSATVASATPANMATTHVTPTPSSVPTATPTPVPSPAASPTTVTPTSTPLATASPVATATAAPAASPSATPTAAPQTYVIQSGDTLTSIAAQFGVTVQQLVDLNHLANPNLIISGTVLEIPPH